MLLLKRSAPEGVKLMELLTSLFCMCTVILVAQMVFTCFISYVVFVNPIMITPGLVMYALVLLLAGWMGFFFGKLQQVFNDRKKKKKTRNPHTCAAGRYYDAVYSNNIIILSAPAMV